MCTGSNGGTGIDPETTTEETTTTSTITAAMAATTTTSEATTTTALTTIATTETTVVSTEGAATTALTNTATTESLATTVGTNIREPSPTITPLPTTTTKTPIRARETTTKKSSELSSVKSNRELPTTSSSSEGLTDTVVRVIETTSVSGDVEPTTAQTETSQNSSSQGEIGWFEEYQGTTIAETHLVSSVASPVALRTTGTMETCQQTCLTTMMNTFQCWAVTIPDPSSDECILYYIDSVSNLRAPSVMVALAGAILLLKLQDSNPVSGLPCACRLDFNWDLPPNVSREEMLEMLQETLDQLKGELSVKKNETQKYQRTLISAEDNRTSAVGLGSMGVALLVTVFGFVVVADIPYLVALFNFFKRRYNRKINNAPS
ncbi:uncharacterized protein [Argopecten irradians]|uniref:uncharacterized protein n=1 Tax=Argopecten irradians TaxID=31199 RepID=UPI00371F6256